MRWRRLLQAWAVAGPLLVAVGAAVVGPGAVAGPASAQDDVLEEGRQLYNSGCVSCHGVDGSGVEIVDGSAGGPALDEAGEAGAYYYLTTGRMPLSDPNEQPTRKDPAYDPEQIEALVAYVASLGDGPELPDVDIEGADLAEGGLVYRANCQACHSASGSGGALSYGRAAPRLADATPTQVGAAVRTGPGEMPVFGSDIVTDDDLDDLAAYVEYLRSPEDPGGLPIGRTGPIPEGFVAWLVGIGAFLALVFWIGTRSPVGEAAAEVDGPGPGADDAVRADEPEEEHG
jgi:ubiquinol-cytochrome c reductase cytochrome c subunit